MPIETLRVDHTKPFLCPHPLTGYVHPPGNYRLVFAKEGFEGALETNVAADDEGYRLASSVKVNSERKPELWFFGCSFTWGLNVETHHTYPWTVQNQFPGYFVRNYGVCGFGTVHYLQQLKSLVKERRPRLALFTHADFHLYRNVANPSWLRGHGPHGLSVLEQLRYPRAQLNNGKLSISLIPFTEDNLKQPDYALEEQIAVTKAIYSAILKCCEEEKIKPIVVILSADMEKDPIAQWMAQQSVDVVDCAIDWKTPGYNQMPMDGHPNKCLQGIYAQRISTFLNKIIT